MVEFTCTMKCDSCGATKPAVARLNSLTAALPMTPFEGLSYESEDGEEPWQIIHPGAKVACSEVCHAKLLTEIHAAHNTTETSAVSDVDSDTTPPIEPANNN